MAKTDARQRRLHVQKTKLDELTAAEGENIIDNTGDQEAIAGAAEDSAAPEEVELEAAPSSSKEQRVASPKPVHVEQPLDDAPSSSTERRVATPKPMKLEQQLDDAPMQSKDRLFGI